MVNNNRGQLRTVINLTATSLVFSLFGWIYFMGIVCPRFASPFAALYRGLGTGMLYLLYFQLMPSYVKRFFPGVRYAPAAVPLASAVITVILLFAAFPLQVFSG